MGYSVTVYMASTGDNADPYVETIDIYMGAAGKVDSVDYGEESHTTSGLTDEITLKPTLADGYVIKRWVYHVGSESAITLYSYTTNFTYTPADPDNPANLYIRAESEPDGTSGGGGDDPEDYIVTESLITIKASRTDDWGQISRNRDGCLENKTIIRPVCFEKSGYVTFSMSVNPSAESETFKFWVSLSDTILQNGQPSTYLQKKTAYGDGAKYGIELYVDIDTTYYFIIQYIPTVEGSMEMHWINKYISPIRDVAATGSSNLYIYNNGWVAATPYIYNGSQWVQASPYILNG